MKIRPLAKADASAYQELRLRALREHPDAFTSSYEEDRLKPLAWAESRVVPSAEAPDNFVLGAFDDGKLVGILGMSVEPRVKVRHKGHVFGMYVAPEYAGRGVGQELMAQCIRRARDIAALEQLQLTVTESNVRAKAFYEKAGFRSFGVERNAVKIGERYAHKCHMTLSLREGA
ncbi:MAG TPA: GNAT family N-acetyltransferase [Burkholderiales bacterium]|nr:GNAT family N-acetyltransferase [Burkholderiales bacterium]